MSEIELELLKVKLETRVKMTQTLIAGIKDLLVVVASVATLYIQTTNAGKIDLAAQAAASTNAINTKWWAERTGDPLDAAKAERAEAKLSNMP